MTEDEMRRGVQDADDRRVAALVARDYDAFAAILSDSLVYQHGSGKVDTKASYLVQFREGRVAFLASRFEDVRTHVVGGAVIRQGVAHNDLIVDGRPLGASSRFFSVWGHENGQWRMAAWASAPLE